MAFDAFIKIDGIEGESTDSKYQGWIELISYHGSMTQTVSRTASSVGGATAERVDFNSFGFTKFLDKASPLLAMACAGGTHINTIVFDYDHPKDQFSGITMPGSIAKWFSSSDFIAIRQNTNTVFDESLYNLLQAHKQYNSGACVCLFVGANVLQGFPKGKSPADHWVVMNSTIRIDRKSADTLLSQGKRVNQNKDILSKKIEFSIYTWGQEKYQINSNNPNLTVGEFLDYYYGYVAAQ